MGKFYILTQILQGNALFTGKIYTARKFFTRPPVATVVTNFKSGCTKLPKMPPLSAGQSHIIKKSNNKALMKDKARENIGPGP